MTPERLVSRFRESIGSLPGVDAVIAARTAAMEHFGATGFPTRRLEDWRYTDLKNLAAAEYDPVFPTAPPDRVLNVAASVDWMSSGAGILFVDGTPQGDPEKWPALPGMRLTRLAEAWASGTAIGSPDYDAAPLAAVNTAFAADGLSVTVEAGRRIDTPLHLAFATTGRPDIAPQPRLRIGLEADAEITIVISLTGSDAAPTWTNLVSEIVLEPRSRLTIYRIQDIGNEDTHTELLAARVGEAAALEAGYIDLGGQLVRNDIRVELAEEGAACDIFGVFVADTGKHIDNHLCVDHAAPHTTSRETLKGIVGDRGRGVFNGKVIVRPDAQKIDATQSSDNLLLSDRAEIDTKPELEIYADDVKCSHGATVGQIDESQLFYLRSRGLDDSTARGLMTFAFGNEILQRLPISEIRQPVARRLLARLQGEIDWDELL